MADRGKKPNILLVFSDQHRWCDVGCYGNNQVVTPNLDAFAKNSVRFSNCVSNSPLCVPARGSLLTGLFPMRHGGITNDLPMRHDVTSMAHVLRDNGYLTGYIGKWHLVGVPRDQHIPAGEGRFGFEAWKVSNCCHDYLHTHYYDEKGNRIAVEGYEPITQTGLAIDFMNENRDKAWALVVSWGPPHDPYFEVPERYLDLYRAKELKLRENVPESVTGTPERTFRAGIAERYKGYYAHITALDEQFGRLIAALEATGQMDDTVVVYTSDHGDMLGSHGFMNKQLPHEESIKVPLMVCWKGKTFAGVSEEMIGLVDLPVSLLGLVGLRFPSEVDGVDLHGLFVRPGARGMDECYIFEFVPCHQAAARGGTEWRGIRTRRYTFVRSASDDGFLLFDNANDPYQMRNLIDDPGNCGIKEELLKTVDRFIAKHDRLLPWEELVRQFGFTDAWNKSQEYFGLPVLR